MTSVVIGWSEPETLPYLREAYACDEIDLDGYEFFVSWVLRGGGITRFDQSARDRRFFGPGHPGHGDLMRAVPVAGMPDKFRDLPFLDTSVFKAARG